MDLTGMLKAKLHKRGITRFCYTFPQKFHVHCLLAIVPGLQGYNTRTKTSQEKAVQKEPRLTVTAGKLGTGWGPKPGIHYQVSQMDDLNFPKGSLRKINSQPAKAVTGGIRRCSKAETSSQGTSQGAPIWRLIWVPDYLQLSLTPSCPQIHHVTKTIWVEDKRFAAL